MGWDAYKKEIEKLGRYKLSGKSCLAIKSIEDIDLRALTTVLKHSFIDMKNKYRTER